MKSICIVVLALVMSCSFAKDEHSSKQADALEQLRNSHLYFTRNDGQIDTHGKADCRFTTNVGGANYFFCADGIVADYRKEDVARVCNPQTDRGLQTRATNVVGHVLKLNFLNRTNFLVEVKGEDEQEYKCNYFIGNDAAKWHTSVPNYSRIVYNNVWQGIDVVYRSPSCQLANAQRDLTSRATLEYDVIVHPGANPNQIQFAYEGQDALSIDSNGNLVLKTSVGDIIEQTPYVYQIIDGVKKEIPSRFIIHNSSFSIQVGSYDLTHDLVIDPIYSTYLAGNQHETAYGIAIDADGSAFVTGTTQSTIFPTTPGAYKSTGNNGGWLVFVTKFNASGSALNYSTFLGSASSYNYDRNGIAVDVEGNAYVTGSATPGFPTTPNAFQKTSGGNEDAFVTKLNARGDSLIYSTYLGGNGLDGGQSIAIDSSGYAYITGHTSSNTFPTTIGAYQPVLKGTENAFVTKLKPKGDTLVFSSYLGGAEGVSNSLGTISTVGNCIDIDRNGNAFLTGTTNCYDFPTTTGAFQPSRSPSVGAPSLWTTAFMTKFSSDGGSLVYSTYLGAPSGNGIEEGYGIAIDDGGNAFITGSTSSTNFPITAGAFQPNNGGNNNVDVFVTKLKTAGQGNNDLLYSTYLGGAGGSETGRGIAVGNDGNAYITGTAGVGFPTTAGAFKTTGAGVFVTKLKPTNQGGNDLLYSTYVGGGIGYGMVIDSAENIFITGQASPFSTFPTTPGAYQTTKGPGNFYDAFVTKFCFKPYIQTIDSLDIGHVSCDPVQKTFVIYNPSEISLKVDSIKIVDTTNFTVVSPETFPVVVSQNSSTQITINFKIGTPGNKTTTLKIYSNDCTPSLKKITLVGVVGPKNRFFALSTTKLDFGSIACDSSAPDLKIIVYDTSNTSLQVKPTITGSASYTIAPSDTTIDVGDSAVFMVHFQPITGGTHNAKLWFDLPQCSRVDTIAISGIKNSSVSFTALPHTLEYFSCRQKEVDSVIIIKNTGSAPLTLDSGVVSGLGFSLVSPKGKVTVAPGDSVKYVIRFTSTQFQDDKYTGTFTVSGPCQAISQHDVVVWKTSLFITPKSIDFGGLSCSTQYRDTSVTLTSKGGPAIVTANTVGDAFFVLTPSATIKSDSSKDFRIRFKPDSAGNFHGKLIFTTSVCPGVQDTIDLVGGKASTVCLSSEPKALQFDTLSCVASGGNEEESVITLCNCSTSQITLDSAHVSGNNFTLISPLGKKTLPGGQCQDYTIRFSPSGPGTYTGTFNINGMPCYISYSVPLQGVCKSPSDVHAEKELPLEFSLDQNHPNPFSRFTITGCRLSIDASFEVRDMLGRIVYHTHVSKNSTEVMIDASGLPNGLYLYSLNDGKNIQSRMMMVVMH